MTATIHALPTARRSEPDPRADAERAYINAHTEFLRWPSTGTLVAYMGARRDYLTLVCAMPYHAARALAEVEASKMRHAAVLEGCYQGDPEGDL